MQKIRIKKFYSSHIFKNNNNIKFNNSNIEQYLKSYEEIKKSFYSYI